MKKLTEAQRAVLTRLGDGDEMSAYRARARLDTLRALERRGLVRSRGELGSMAFPHTNIEWRITPAGRAALEQEP